MKERIKHMIYEIKTFVYHLVGGQLSQKKRQTSNNPKLTKLMNEKMTFKQLKDKEVELEKQRLDLIAKQSSIRFSKQLYNKEFSEKDYNEISDEIYQIDDLIKGIKAKISEVGFEYEYVVERELPKSDGGSEIWVDRKTIILGKEYPEKLSSDDLIEFMISINIKTGEFIKSIRLINKKF
jgi:hypothetical protein